MSIVRVEQDIQPLKYLVITQQKDPDSVITTNVVISDNRLNRVNLIAIEKGSTGNTGPIGPQGIPGKDGIVFDILPVESGGTNNSIFNSGNIIYYDGNRLSSSQYTLQDIANGIGNGAAVTGVFAGSGLSREISQNSVTLNADVGEGLFINEINQIAVDNTIVRKVELNLGSIDGVVPISKGGTNNQTFNSNKLIYYDGTKIASFPLATGRLLLSGTTIDIIAGSGLTGGGHLSLPTGSVVLNIGSSTDIIVENSFIRLSETGVAGTYSKVTTDDKGRVVAGSNLTSADILNFLGYVPWHAGNDGADSGLDADLLDGLNGSYYLNASNLTGVLDTNIIPSSIDPGTYTKVSIDKHGFVTLGDNLNYFDSINALGYRPVSSTGDIINGTLVVNGDVTLNSNQLVIKDNLPTIGTNSNSILPSEPRGFSFIYGGFNNKTGIFAYYPSEQALKLITNISSNTGTINGGDANNNFTNEIDGGNQISAFPLPSITGQSDIVLLKNTADSLYVSRSNNQVVSGSKIFANKLTVNEQIAIVPTLGQTSSPFDLAGNSGLVESLNADLLDGNNGVFYTDASNMTGLFTYEKVNFDHLEGTVGRIPKFDSRTNNPSRTISDSFVRQTGNSVQITDNANLVIGTITSTNNSNRTLLVGNNNASYSTNSLAAGSNNTVSGDNSVALNIGSKTYKATSIAAGDHGYTWANNQFSFGGFEETDQGQKVAQGQYSSVSLYLNGTQTDGSWVTMSPPIIIPKNKTIGYNLQLLMHKSAGTGAAMISFQSGIIKNSTVRDPNNISLTKNITSVLKDSTKQEIYNDSQYRKHYFTYQLEDEKALQNLNVTRTPLNTNPITVQNVQPLYKYTPNYSSLSGSYSKSNDGSLVLNLSKPISSGWFTQNSDSNKIVVRSYDHGMVTGCVATMHFTSGTNHLPVSRKYEINTIIDQNNFIVNESYWSGTLTNNNIIINPIYISEIDSDNKIKVSGYIYTNGSTISNILAPISGIIHTGMIITYGPNTNEYPSSLIQTGIVTACTNDLISFYPPFTGIYNNSTINALGFCEFKNYSRHIFDSCHKLYIDIPSYGRQSVTNLSKSIETISCGYNTISVNISGLTASFSGQSVKVYPADNNIGLLDIIPKRNYTGTYIRQPTQFEKYQGIYVRSPSVDGYSNIAIYNKNLENIVLPYVPFSYDFVCGYGDTDNDLFHLEKINLDTYLKINDSEIDRLKDAYSVRIRASDRSNRHIEKSIPIIVSGTITTHSLSDNVASLSVNPITQTEDMISLNITNNIISDTILEDTTIGKLLVDGSYLPYIIFDNASNSFIGVLHSGSPIITECFATTKHYSTVDLYGDISQLFSGLALSSTGIGLPATATISGIEDPISFSGLVTSGSNYIAVDNISNISKYLFSGTKVFSDLTLWPLNTSITSIDQSGIFVNNTFLGPYENPENTRINTIGYNIILNQEATRTETDIVTYTSVVTNSGHYYVDNLQTFTTQSLSSWCPTNISNINTKGFSIKDSVSPAAEGHYATGTVSFYTYPGDSYTLIDIYDDLNIESIENSIYLQFISSNTGDIPKNTGFQSVDLVSNSQIAVNIQYLFPDKAPYSTGFIGISLDRNHGYKILENQVNQIPVSFTTTELNNSNRKPKNNLFDVLSINGNTIILDDSKNYLLKENNRPDYFEQPIQASYSTNGFSFSGTLVSGENRIYECNSNEIFSLEKNMILGCYEFDRAPDVTRFDSIVSSGGTFSGIVYKDSNTITIQGQPNICKNQIIFSSIPGWSNGAIYLTDIIGITGYLSSSINWLSESSYNGVFWTLPVISINQKVCIPQDKMTNKKIFFNGNIAYIDNLSTPRAYLNTNDQIKILNFNDDNRFVSNKISRYAQILDLNNEKTSLRAIAINGEQNIIPINDNINDIYARNRLRHSYSFGFDPNTELPKTGRISFIGSVSGYCNIPYNNNMYYHSYGGSTASWPMDGNGKLVNRPQTGVYFISTSSEPCTSGTICITIKGFNGTNFNNIPDKTDRSNIGKYSNWADTFDGDGFVRQWGVNKKLYFDFSDDLPDINGSYYINDKIDSNTITLNIPYKQNYLNHSGLVYMIDSDFNVKSNLNPNIDNAFITVPSQVIISGANNQLIDYYIDSYNSSSKRWKHLVHFNKNINSFSGYDISVDNQIHSELISISPETIKINSITYSTDNGSSYLPLDINNTININSNLSEIYLKIQISDGSGKWSSGLQKSCPKINIFGIGSYLVDTNNIIYDNLTKNWIIYVLINGLIEFTNSKPISVTASDESGSYTSNIYLTTKILPVIPVAATGYSYQNSNEYWLLAYDIKNLNLINDYTISVTGYAGLSYDILNEELQNSNNTKIITGPPGANTGIYSPSIIIRDLISSEILAQQTSTIKILSLSEDLPEYSIQPQGFDDDIYLDITDSLDNTASFSFFLPAINSSSNNLNIHFDNNINYTITPTVEYSYASNRYRITITITGDIGSYLEQSMNISIYQPVVGEDDQIRYVQYFYSKIFNLTIYKKLQIDKTQVTEPLVFDIKQPWSIQFKTRFGIGAHHEELVPKIRLAHLPNLGNYENQPLEYTLSVVYDEQSHTRQIYIVGKADVFGNYTNVLGDHTVKIYVEDSISHTESTFSLIFTKTPYLDNVQDYIYSTPNNQYQSVIDIKQPRSIITPPQIIFPGNDKENTINLNKYYNKYDKYFDAWEFAYSGDAILQKWDSYISITNINQYLSDNQYSSIQVNCKGIATDKIYGIGKLDLIELDTNILPGIPLKIVDVPEPTYSASEGSEWQISFGTIGGLENPNYPPTIILSGLPSVCSGFNPKIPIEEQNSCLLSHTWNSNDKKWTFNFKGLPLCGIQGVKPFTIVAIDTDTDQNQYFGSDIKNSQILYSSLEDQGVAHPAPQIIPATQGGSFTIPLTPSCNSPIDKSFKFGTKNRAICPIPTGITGWAISGSLPSGLMYNITFPGGTPERPWNNLSSGTLRIYGNPESFANGGTYPESLYLIVFDARNKSITKQIQFVDTSLANPPSPINLTVYFDSIKPSYTPRKIDPAKNNDSYYGLGTLPVDRYNFRSVKAMWPQAETGSLLCTSRLPQNQCQTSSFRYVGGNIEQGDIKVFIYDNTISLAINDIVYIEFDNDTGNTSGFNGKYSINIDSSQNRYISIPGHSFVSGYGRLVKARSADFITNDLQKFNGILDINTSSPILGCGTIRVIEDIGGYGLFGRIRPSFIATIPTSGAFDNNDVYFDNLKIDKIQQYIDYPSMFTAKTSDCWQTGYLRISGIAVPKPSLELTNPPPAYDFAPFSYNNQAYSVLSRCTYGTSQYEKDRSENYRSTTANYRIKNVTSNIEYSQGSVQTLAAGANNGQSIQFNNIYASGAVMCLSLWNNPSTFPTYVYNSIPYTDNEYFWIHKAGNRDDTPTQASFPPIIITGIKNSISCISGVPISGFNIRAIGGYIPFGGSAPSVPFYTLPDSTIWSLSSYSPLITGILQSKLNISSNNGTYSHAGGNTGLIITLPNSTFIPGDIVSLTFNPSIIPSTGIILPIDYTNTITIPLNRSSNEPVHGSVVAYNKCLINSINNNSIILTHNNLVFNTGDCIDITTGSSVSTEFNIFPNNYRLSISSGDSRYIYANCDAPLGYTFTNGLIVSGVYDIKKNYYDQINVNNISYIKAGEWSASLSGTPTGIYKDYTYKLMSIENTGLPTFSGTSLTAKKYTVEYPLYINKPIKIILPTNIQNNGLINTNGSWTLSFSIDGGSRPVYNNIPEIIINNSICNFTRNLSNINMNDPYNQLTDMLDVTLTSVNSSNYNWRDIQIMELKVIDDTGSDTVTIYLNQ